MRDRELSEHVLHVWAIEDSDELDYGLLHPEECSVWVGSKPDPWGYQKRYECAVTAEIEAVGFDSMFPDGLITGWWALSPWWHRIPSTPNGPEEWDAGVEVMRLTEAINQ
jgi:hypothetical protein